MQLATFAGLQASIQDSVLIIPKARLGTGVYDSALQFSRAQLPRGSLLRKDSTISFLGAAGESLPRTLSQGGSLSRTDSKHLLGATGATEMR